MLQRLTTVVAISMLLSLGAVPVARADNAPASPAANAEDARRAELKSAFLGAMTVATKGPADVPLMSQATLKLPAGYLFVPVGASNRLMKAYGNSEGGPNFAGLIMPADPSEDWFITASYLAAGYVKDEEAKNWDVDGLLKNSRDGVEADNADREQRGFPKIKVDGWIEKPIYDATQHRLAYSMSLSGIDAKPGEETTINYHTYALGREGYFALDLVTGSGSIDTFKERAKTVLASLDYNKGKRYQEFVASTDHIAEYGIAALVGGIAAKKLGLLALAALAMTKFGGALVAFAKPIGVGVLALFAGIGRFFGRKKS